MSIENEYNEDSGCYQIQARLQESSIRFKILDKTDGVEVLTGGVALNYPDHREEVVLLVKKYLRKFAELNP